MSSQDSQRLADRLDQVRERIAAAARRSGRKPDEVALLAVSKTMPAERIREAIAAGQHRFAENRVQELADKADSLGEDAEWDLIGHLQTNKVRKALSVARRIHSLDSVALARRIDRIAEELGVTVSAWLQVNVGGEDTKGGFEPEAVEAALTEMQGLSRLEICGLMTVPPFTPSPEDARPAFVVLRQLRDQLVEQTHHPLPRLSMGMSHDFEVAIEEGATEVRVGSAIFGARDTN